MDPDAEAAFSPEFDLVAMAEQQNATGIDIAQAVMTAEPGIPVSNVAAESAASESVSFDELDDRRQAAVGACGVGACGSCVQKCGSYNPDNAVEEFDLVKQATEEPEGNDFDFRSAVQFKGEEARQRMAERKAAKTVEAQSKVADRPTPEQRDQIIEIRETAANPERVRENLAHGHARMAERQKERKDRMAEQAEPQTVGETSKPVADIVRPTAVSVQQARAEYNSRRPAEPKVAVKAAEAIQAQITKPQPEEVADAVQRRPSEQLGDKTSRPNEAKAQYHADQIYARTTSAQTSEASMTQSRKVGSEHAQIDQPDAIIESAVHEQQRIHSNLIMRHEDSASSGSTQTSLIVRSTPAREPKQTGARPYNATSSDSELFHVDEEASLPEPKEAPTQADSTQMEEAEAEGNEMPTPIVQTDAYSETSDSEPASPTADSKAQHDFHLAVPAADAPNHTETTPDHHAVSDNKINMEVSIDPDADKHAHASLQNRKKQKTRRELPHDNAEEVRDIASVEVDVKRTAVAPSKKNAVIKGLAKPESVEIEQADELDQAEVEANDELQPENFDYVIVHNQEPRRKYSGGGEIEDIWKPSPNNRGKKSVPQNHRRARSSSSTTHKAKRNRKKISKLLVALGRFVTYNFSRQQQEVNEGVEI